MPGTRVGASQQGGWRGSSLGVAILQVGWLEPSVGGGLLVASLLGGWHVVFAGTLVGASQQGASHGPFVGGSLGEANLPGAVLR